MVPLGDAFGSCLRGVSYVQAIFNMVGPSLTNIDPNDTPDRRTQEIFDKMDENHDGVLTKDSDRDPQTDSGRTGIRTTTQIWIRTPTPTRSQFKGQKQDGVLTKEEFVKGCMADEFLYQMLTADTSGSGP